MSKTRKFKLRHCAACLIVINDDLDVFTESKASDKIVEMELNKILLKTIPNV